MILNKKDWTYVDIWSKKIRAINILGGKCNDCGDTNIFHLTFHHLNDDKDSGIGDIRNYRWSKIEREIKKCILLCSNCHQSHHYSNEIKSDHKKNKNLYLEYRGRKCEKCGYDKCQASLILHHKNPNEKSFSLTDIRVKFNDKVKKELDKCDVLCSNCHLEEHINKITFERLKDKIYNKVNKIREVQTKIPRDIVYKMFDMGIKQSDIAIKFNASKGTISEIIKNRPI